MPLCRETDGERQTKRQKRTGTVGCKETSWVYSWGHYQHLFLFNQLSNTNPPFYSVSLMRTQISYYCHPESHKLLVLPFCLRHAPTAAILAPTCSYCCHPEAYKRQLLQFWGPPAPEAILRATISCSYHPEVYKLLFLPSTGWQSSTAAILRTTNPYPLILSFTHSHFDHPKPYNLPSGALQYPSPSIPRPTSTYFTYLQAYKVLLLKSWGLEAPTPAILRSKKSYFCHP